MKSVRLFVGGLGEGVNETKLTSKLSPYGSISNVEVKEKTDAEGIVTLRFAYVNIEAPQDQLENCLRTLNGDTWSGSNLRIEVAKESFLDRLKRERAKRQGQQQADVQTESEKGPSGHKADPKKYEVIPNEKRRKWHDFAVDSGVLVEKSLHSAGGQDVWPPKEDAKVQKKDEKEELMLESFKSFSSFWADSDEDEQTVPASTGKRKRQLDDEQPEKTSNFRDVKMEVPTFNEVRDKRENWGRPQRPERLDIRDSEEPSKSIRRYDPALEENQQLKKSSPAEVKMEVQDAEAKVKEEQPIQHKPQKPLVFNQKETTDGSDSFSLLSLFKEMQAPKKMEKDQVEEIKSKSISNEAEGLKKTEEVESMCTNLLSMFTNVEPKGKTKTKEKTDTKEKRQPQPPKYIQRKSFFIQPGDERILDGINWVKSYNEEMVHAEFKRVEEELYDVIKTRSIRATRELNKNEDQSTEKTFKKRKHSEPVEQTEVLLIDDDNYYDQGWRLAELEKQKKENKDQSNGSKHEGNDDKERQNKGRSHFNKQERRTFSRNSPASFDKKNAGNGRHQDRWRGSEKDFQFDF